MIYTLITLLQTGYYGEEMGFYGANGMGYGVPGQWGMYLLMIVIGVVGYIVQARLQAVTKKYSQVMFPGGLTGKEVAEKMLRDNNIHNVKVTHVAGQLTDHFNPATMTVNLSDTVYASRSVTAAAVAAHECGHAVQHAQGYAPLVLRSQLVPIVSFASSIATWVILAGLVLLATTQNELVCWIGIGLIATSALFSIVTLPVEYNASARALAWLKGSRMMTDEQLGHARTSLNWAARTYLVAALSAIASVLYYVFLILGRRD
ncbi:MAG: zinc metallopeptidase [Alistipes sp.]|nr:zinc metallopeptidase [Alistipes sp.]MBQ6861612.1 zinc metallopeptidase [Alistipes sp.]